MEENFTKLNDYTLQVTQDMTAPDIDPRYYEHRAASTLTRLFNFRAAQVTTILNQGSMVAGYSSSQGGAGVSSSAQMFVQNFDDIQSQLEIDFMHKKLKELGGTPPALEDLRSGLGKKSGLTAARNGG